MAAIIATAPDGVAHALQATVGRSIIAVVCNEEERRLHRSNDRVAASRPACQIPFTNDLDRPRL